MIHRSLAFATVFSCLVATHASAQTADTSSAPDASSQGAGTAASPSGDPSGQVSAVPKPAADYSDAYRLRAKIHRIGSFAILPLFGAEVVVGQSLYNDPTSTKKTAHLLIAGGIGTLFAVNSVTGIWNLLESRSDPNNRRRRIIHSVLMLAADGGFLATAALGPSSEHEGGGQQFRRSPATHRAVAFTSIGLGTAGYLVMLLGGHS